jgi:predicted dehydrogenase
VKAGKPVYVEKPMARNYKECLDMIEACNSANVPLFAAYYRRALDRFNKIKELIESGAIGKVRFVSICLYQKPEENEFDRSTLSWRVIPEIAGAGKFLDLAPHTLDILDYILGPVKAAKGHATNQAGLYEAEDTVSASLLFDTGIQGSGIWCFSAHKNYDMNEIVGSNGRIAFSTFGREPVLLENEKGLFEYPIVNPVHIQQQLIQTIVDELNGVGKCPSTGVTGARTSWVTDEILKDYYQMSH